MTEKPTLQDETDKLNDLMEEAFGIRPIYQGMEMSEFHAWNSKLARHWIEQLKIAVQGLED